MDIARCRQSTNRSLLERACSSLTSCSPEVPSLLRQSDAMHEVGEARVGAERIHSEIDLDEVNDIWGSLVGRFCQESEGLLHLPHAQIYGVDHVRGDVGDLRLALQFAKYLLSVGHPTYC